MAKWHKSTMRLRKDHKWKAKPGYNVFVADRGAVRFDFPQEWVVIPEADSIKFYDKQPPDDDCRLQVTVMRLNPEFDWSGLPLAELFESVTGNDNQGDDHEELTYGPITRVRRQDLELAWREGRFVDPIEKREAFTRTCLARSGTILPLITLDFWPEDAARLEPVWNEVLRSLRLGQYVKDPRRGAQYGYG